MEDVILFNPAFWNSMPENYRETIVATFNEVIPELIAHKAKSRRRGARPHQRRGHADPYAGA